MMKVSFTQIGGRRLLINLSREIYEKEAIMGAAYKMAHACTILISPVEKKAFRVAFELKGEKAQGKLEKIAKDFCNEVLEQQVRLIPEIRGKTISELSNPTQEALLFDSGGQNRQEKISQALLGKGVKKDVPYQSAMETIRQWLRQNLVYGMNENMFDYCLDHFASILISEALSITRGNRARAAKLLGLSRPTLLSRIEKYKIKVETSLKIIEPFLLLKKINLPSREKRDGRVSYAIKIKKRKKS
jgi:His-Xaa-Ser system protein HxsD